MNRRAPGGTWVVGLALLLVTGLAACYAPATTDCRVKCGPQGTCPDGLVCSVGLCARSAQSCHPLDPEILPDVPTARDGGGGFDNRTDASTSSLDAPDAGTRRGPPDGAPIDRGPDAPSSGGRDAGPLPEASAPGTPDAPVAAVSDAAVVAEPDTKPTDMPPTVTPPCPAGDRCGGSECSSGRIDCSSGRPVCKETPVNDGVPCGNRNRRCSGDKLYEGDRCRDGKCDSPSSSCAMGCDNATLACRVCTPVREDCSNGRDDDCDGAIDCADSDCAPGASCGSGKSCIDKRCQSCEEGASCTPKSGANSCKDYHLRCGDGSGACNETGNKAAGTTCTQGGNVASCDGVGQCLGCSAGKRMCPDMSCQPQDDAHCGTACMRCPGPEGGKGAGQCTGGSCTIRCDANRTVEGGRCVCKEGFVECDGGCIPFGGDGRTRSLCAASSSIGGDQPFSLCEALKSPHLIVDCPPESPAALGAACKRFNGLNTMTYSVHEFSIDNPTSSRVTVRHFCCMSCEGVASADATCNPRPGAERKLKDCSREP